MNSPYLINNFPFFLFFLLKNSKFRPSSVSKFLCGEVSCSTKCFTNSAACIGGLKNTSPIAQFHNGLPQSTAQHVKHAQPIFFFYFFFFFDGVADRLFFCCFDFLVIVDFFFPAADFLACSACFSPWTAVVLCFIPEFLPFHIFFKSSFAPANVPNQRSIGTWVAPSAGRKQIKC